MRSLEKQRREASHFLLQIYLVLKLTFPAFPSSYSLDSLVPSPLLALHLASAQLCCVFEHGEWNLFRFSRRISPHQHAALGRRSCLQLQDMHIDQSFPFVTLHPAIDFNCSLLKRKHSVHVQLAATKFLLSTPFARRCLRSALQSCGSLLLSKQQSAPIMQQSICVY